MDGWMDGSVFDVVDGFFWCRRVCGVCYCWSFRVVLVWGMRVARPLGYYIPNMLLVKLFPFRRRRRRRRSAWCSGGIERVISTWCLRLSGKLTGVLCHVRGRFGDIVEKIGG